MKNRLIQLSSVAISMGALAVAACGDDSREDAPATSLGTPTSGSPGGETLTGTVPGESSSEGDALRLDVGNGTGGGTCTGSGLGCTNEVDLLFVIDNSGTMAIEQENLARNFPLLVQQLEALTDSAGNPVNADVQIMVTTTDRGNVLCTPDRPEGYEPANGRPVTIPCTERLSDFTDRRGEEVVPEACENTCPADVAPEGDPFVAFNAGGDNIPDDITEADINGDDIPDSPVAQALGCIGPQGINGCGFESPLEGMMQALNPGAEWNTSERPFLRPDALLAIAIITDEADCSVLDSAVMDDPAYQELDPEDGMPDQTSAICWNAGVTCEGPDENGVYSACTSSNIPNTLQPLSRYTGYLVDSLRESQGKEVVMLGILGVPEVTAHSPEAPFEPVEGGVAALEYRDWQESDILPGEDDTPEGLQADFGIGPGCTGGNEVDGFTGQAIPPVRIKEVCESLNIENPDGSVDVRCCIESICDDDFSTAIRCLTGIIGEAITVPG